MKLLISVLLIIVTHAVIPATVVNCQFNTYIEFTTATFSYPPNTGRNTQFTLYGQTVRPTELTHVVYTKTLGDQLIERREFKDTSEYQVGDDVIYKQNIIFPLWTLQSGDYELTFRFQDIHGNQAACAQTIVSI